MADKKLREDAEMARRKHLQAKNQIEATKTLK